MSFKISVIVPVYNVETFLSETLDSLVSQSFNDFEVIIINDGSTDGTQDIIDAYCSIHKNFKFIVQANSGTSKAKNRGIDEAQGDYLAFLDGDDKFTPYALEKLFHYAQKKQADLVVGRTKTFNLFNSSYLNTTVELSKKEIIDPFDLTLIWSFSQSNKLFSRKKIIQNNIRFPNNRYSEDGVFVLKFVQSSNIIVGCPKDFLLYRKRFFDEGYSATQSISKEMLKDYLNSHDQIYYFSEYNLKKNINKRKELNGEKNESIVRYYVYLEKIRYKESKILLEQFYRYFWRTDDETIKFIKDKLFELRKELFTNSWQNIVNHYSDLRVNDLINKKEEMAKNPLISVAISNSNMNSDKINLMLKYIYHQDFPAFELFISKRFEKLISPNFKHENLHFIEDLENQYFKKLALDKSKGDYMIFFDDYYILAPDMFREMYNHLEKSELDFVSVKLMSIRLPTKKRDCNELEKKIFKYPSQERIYSKKYLKNRSNIFLDLYFSNKMIKTKFLKNQFKFTTDSAYDIKILYENASYKKIPGNLIFSPKREKEIIKLAYSQKKSIYMKTRYLYIKLKIFHIPSMIKNRINI